MTDMRARSPLAFPSARIRASASNCSVPVPSTAIRVTRDCGVVQCLGIYAERAEVHLGLAWLKSLTIRGGQANVIAHIDTVLQMLGDGRLDPSPLGTHTMSLDDAPHAYEIFDRREALKIVLRP